jgi:predicted metal-dependent hydrolase
MERGGVRFGTRTIEFVVRRSARRRTVAIAVASRDGVVVTAPPQIELPQLERLVAARARWIVEAERRFEDVEAGPPPRTFSSGETFHYLGRQYRLRVESHDRGRAEVKLAGAWIAMRLPAAVADDARPELARRALIAWYRRRAVEWFPERVALWSDRLGLTAPAILVREPRARWGSCDPKGNVRLNWRIVQAPGPLVDYVVAHELVHLVHRRHGPDFWAALGRALPAYEDRRRTLRRLGAQYFW